MYEQLKPLQEKIMHTQVDEYSAAVGRNPSPGITVLIHDQFDPPVAVADTNGMLIGPGVHASIGFKKQKVRQGLRLDSFQKSVTQVISLNTF